MILTKTKLSNKFLLMTAIITTMVVMFFATLQVNAAAAAPTNLKQTSAFGSYAKIRWDEVQGIGNKYQIQVSQDNKTYAVLATTGNTYYSLSGLLAGKVYYVKVAAVQGTTVGTFTAPLQIISQPGNIAELKQTAIAKTSVGVTWSAAAGAGAYDVYVGTSLDTMKYKQTVKTTKTTIKGLKANKTYIVKVVPFNVAPSGYRASGFEKGLEDVRTTPGKVSGLDVKAWNYASANITVTWTEKENLDGYQVKFYNAADKCVKTINTTETTATFKKAGRNTFYKASIRGYVTVNGKKKYTAYNKKPVYAIAQPQVISLAQSVGKLTIGWNAVEGATSYTIYATTTNPNYPESYVKISDVDKGVVSYSMTKFGNQAVSVFDSYYVYVVANKKVGSKTYTSKTTQAWYAHSN